METIGGEAVERSVVQHDDRIGVLDESASGRDRVVRLHHDVGAAVLEERKRERENTRLGNTE